MGGEYKRFRDLAEEYGDDLVILAFPTREFGAQEFLEDADIARFAEKQQFPGVLLSRTEVLPWAKDQCDTYRFLYNHKKNKKTFSNQLELLGQIFDKSQRRASTDDQSHERHQKIDLRLMSISPIPVQCS